ncbi:MAG TPA: flagellar biosynthesis protein FlhA [Polyangiales bacterium]
MSGPVARRERAVAASLLGARRADVVLAALVVATVGMMIVPLPTALIDVCIALNLTLGVLLLASALYLRNPLSFAAFPTLLLLSTLYRLALNVSSTRLILLQADAGRVIEAFGSFVVRGDYVVGALVFAVLTLVQFIVIARGAERVAEVGARFSLDALPGKQLAIDSDLRAGSLSPEGARAQRQELARESQLYGAMDGAMKFVKGDAIAGIVITLVNLLGGVTIGVVSRQLGVEESLKQYALLTIGDGIVTQIPALLSATAAGLVVTRVSSADGEGSLGRDIGDQLFGDARVLAVAALLLAVIALVPGMPALPFLLAAALCAGLMLRARARPRTEAQSRAHAPQPRALDFASIELGPELAGLLLVRGKPSPALGAALDDARRRFDLELGLLLPAPQVRANGTLAARAYRLAWRELAQPVETLPDLGGVETRLADALLRTARRAAEDCLGLDVVQQLLDALERQQPALVRLLVPRVIPLPLLARVLRVLVREGVSVRWLGEILDAIAPLIEHAADPATLADAARRALARRISQQLAADGTLPLLRLSPTLEETLHDALRHDAQRTWLALPAALAEDIVEEVSAARQAAPEVRALLTSSPLRRHVHGLVHDAAPELAVVCPEELLPGTQLVVRATIGP